MARLTAAGVVLILIVGGIGANTTVILAGIAVGTSLVLLFLASERAEVLEEISAVLQRERSTVVSHRSQDTLFRSLGSAIESALVSEPKPRRLDWCSFHGHRGQLVLAEGIGGGDTTREHFREVNPLLVAAMSNPVEWKVRHLISVPSEERWSQLKNALSSRLANTDAAEIKVLVTRRAPSAISVLIVANYRAFLAFDDLRTIRPGSGLELMGDGIAIVRDYFEELWTDTRTVLVKGRAGVVTSGMDEVDGQLANLDGGGTDGSS